MSQLTGLNEQDSPHTPLILELLSELETRDRDNTGTAPSAHFESTGFQDPRGCAVTNATGNDVGKVEDIYVDPTTREPRFAVLNLGSHPLGVGNRHVLVDFDDVEIEDEAHVHVRTAE